MSLLGSFQFFDHGLPVTLCPGSQRLLAFVALQGRSVTREMLAGAFWPESSEQHAHASLRSAVSRLPLATRAALGVGANAIGLTANVAIDLDDSRAVAHRLLDAHLPLADADLSSDALAALSSDLLPDWYDDWAILEADTWRELRLHGLEALAKHLTIAERYGDAAQAARLAISADPLRESACAALVRVHLAEGNQSSALAVFDAFRSLLQRELGLEPTPRLSTLVRDLRRT